MTTSGQEKLLSLLFSKGRELANIKFFPGSDSGRGLTADDLCNEAHAALAEVFAAEKIVDIPPDDHLEPRTLDESITTM